MNFPNKEVVLSKIFVSPKMVAILIFQIFANAYILKSVLDRADCADFGCRNSIRPETKHFLNTLALTFISFSGRFVFAMLKHYLFFASDPLLKFGKYFHQSKFLYLEISFLNMQNIYENSIRDARTPTA